MLDDSISSEDITLLDISSESDVFDENCVVFTSSVGILPIDVAGAFTIDVWVGACDGFVVDEKDDSVFGTIVAVDGGRVTMVETVSDGSLDIDWDDVAPDCTMWWGTILNWLNRAQSLCNRVGVGLELRLAMIIVIGSDLVSGF